MTRTPGSIVTRGFVTLAAGELAASAIAFVTMIYAARSLGATAYGTVGVAAAVTLYLATIVDGGIELLGPREVAADPRRTGTLMRSLLSARLVGAAVLAVLLAGGSLLALPVPDRTVFAVYALTLIPVALSTRWVHLGLQQSRTPAAVRVLSEAAKLGLVVVMLRDSGDAAGFPLAELGAGMMGAALLALPLWRSDVTAGARFDVNLLSSVARRSSRLVLTAVLGLVIYNADLFFLRFFQGSGEVGLYLAAYALINTLGRLGNTLRLSLLPALARSEDRVAGSQLCQMAVERMFSVGFPAAVGVTLLAPRFIDYAFGAAYSGAGLPLQILIWSIPLLWVRSVFQTALIASGREDRVLHMTAAVAVLALGLNLVFVPSLGAAGAAVTTVVAECARLLVGRRYASEAGFSPPSPWPLWRPIVATLVMGASLGAVEMASPVGSAFVGLLVYLTTLALLHLTRGRKQASGN